MYRFLHISNYKIQQIPKLTGVMGLHYNNKNQYILKMYNNKPVLKVGQQLTSYYFR